MSHFGRGFRGAGGGGGVEEPDFVLAVWLLERWLKKLLLSLPVLPDSGICGFVPFMVSVWSWVNSLPRVVSEGSGISALTAYGSSGMPTGEARMSLLRWPGYFKA